MSHDTKICDVDPQLKLKAEEFRVRKNKTNAAIVLKIDPAKLMVFLEDEYYDITIDELREELPATQPRYVLLSYVHKRDDGRVSYPLMFIFVTPAGCKPELQVMYAGSKNNTVKELGFTKVFEIRSAEEITEEWLKEKLKIFG